MKKQGKPPPSPSPLSTKAPEARSALHSFSPFLLLSPSFQRRRRLYAPDSVRRKTRLLGHCLVRDCPRPPPQSVSQNAPFNRSQTLFTPAHRAFNFIKCALRRRWRRRSLNKPERGARRGGPRAGCCLKGWERKKVFLKRGEKIMGLGGALCNHEDASAVMRTNWIWRGSVHPHLNSGSWVVRRRGGGGDPGERKKMWRNRR